MDLRRSFAEYLKDLYRRKSRRLAFRGNTREELFAWQKETRLRLLKLLGGKGETTPSSDLKRKVVEETYDLSIERLFYQTRPGLWATAYLILPRGASFPVPAVLCPPGHGSGMNQVVFEHGRYCIYKQYPLEIARLGMAALVPEHIGFGERVGTANDSSHAFYYLSLNLLGESMMGFLLWDLQRAIDVLTSLPEVDKERIGCYGLSLGGEMTLLTTALDDRVKCACISGFFSSYASSFLSEAHCGCGYVYGLARELEHADIAALIAPRPLLIESGNNDRLFPVDVARENFMELRKIYGIAGADDHLVHHTFEGEHEISGDVAFDWLKKSLKSA